MAIAISLGADLSSKRATSYTGSISGTTLTVSSVSGVVVIGQAVYAPNLSVAPGTVITAGSGTSWTVSISQTVASTAMSSIGTTYTLASGTYRVCNSGAEAPFGPIYDTGSAFPADTYIGATGNGTVISGAASIPSANWAVLGTNLYKATAGVVDTGALTFPTPRSAYTKITGYISGTTLHVSSTVTNAVSQGQTLWDGTGVIRAGTTVASGSGTTWTVSISQTAGSSGTPITIYGTYGSGQLSSVGPNGNFSEDLWLNGTKLTRVLGQSLATTTNTWWFNPANNSVNIFRTSAPSVGDVYEYACCYLWVYAGGCAPINLQNITFDKFSGSVQEGIINQCQNWNISSCTFQNNTGLCLNLYNGGAQILNSKFLNNGSWGIYASGGLAPTARTNILGCEVAYNNQNLFDIDWGGGGYKAFQYSSVTISGCNFHDNLGVSIWHDSDCADIIISGNKVINSLTVDGVGGTGIFHEISNGTTKICNNYVSNSTGLGIRISTSRNTEVFGNRVIVGASNVSRDSGIGASNNNRGTDGDGIAYQLEHLYVHDNIIVHSTDNSQDGLQIDYAITGTPSIVWDSNIYVTPNTTGQWWCFDSTNAVTQGSNSTWASLQAGGSYEQSGTNLVSGGVSYSVAFGNLKDGRSAGSITPGNVRDVLIDILINAGIFPRL